MDLLFWGALWLLISQQPAAPTAHAASPSVTTTLPRAAVPAAGVNFFSLQQDMEIGAEASAEAEKTFPLVREAGLTRYFQTVGRRLAAVDSLPDFPYRFRIVNSREVNSIGFPGGNIYINRAMLEFASNESELAALIAHEIGHVAARHGTAQLSRQLLMQAPITIAAGLPTIDGWREQLAKLGVSFGVGASFLRYSRDQELEASLMAVRLLDEARFDPRALAALFRKVNEAERGEGIRLPAYVFNHPRTESLPGQVEIEAERLFAAKREPRTSGEFRSFHAVLRKLAYPSEQPATEEDAPSQVVAEFEHPERYRLSHPSGWRATRNGEYGAIIAPLDGIQATSAGDDITHGMMVDFLELPDRQLSLEDATNRLIVHLRQRNLSLRLIPGAQTHMLVSDEAGLRTVLVGKRSAVDPQEVVWVVTRMYYQNLFYMVFVAPEDEFPLYQPVFEQIIRSTRIR